PDDLAAFVGTSNAAQQIRHLIEQVAPTTASVLITGESGTGKEVVARRIHGLSPRRDRTFLAINCSAIPESLMESEIFGHEKGAFTGAQERRAGCFELAEGGTLLLDEIGEMPIGTQAKLLRVLEDRHLRRLGSKQEIPVNVRVLAATNRSPAEAVERGQLRSDLYYRLNVFNLHLPPLRDHLGSAGAVYRPPAAAQRSPWPLGDPCLRRGPAPAGASSLARQRARAAQHPGARHDYGRRQLDRTPTPPRRFRSGSGPSRLGGGRRRRQRNRAGAGWHHGG